MRRDRIAGVPVVELARTYQTPFFLYDAESMRKRAGELKRFDVVRYAQKANSNLAVVKLLREEGLFIDCVSANEIRRALAAGYRGGPSDSGTSPEVVYTADIFDVESLELVLDRRIAVNCGSLDMISQYGASAPGRDITIRVNPGFGHGHSRKTNTGGDQSKHGIWFEQLDDCIRLAREYDLKITGLHTHIGSGCDFEHLAKLCGYMEKFARKFATDIEMLSTGGGLPVPYKPDETPIDLEKYFDLWDCTRKRLEHDFGRAIRLETEPGRYVVAESGYIVTEIRAVKRQGDNLFYLLDAGFNNLARPVMYGSYHPISLASRSGPEIRENDGVEERRDRTVDVVVGGPLCESGDIFTQEEGGYVVTRNLPEARVGDYLILEIAGAYGAVMNSNYNSKPYAEEILLDHGHATLIRKRQTFEQLIQNEII